MVVMERLLSKCVVRQPVITKGITIALIFSVASLLWLSYYVSNTHFRSFVNRIPPKPTIKCRIDSDHKPRRHTRPNDHSSKASLRIDNKVLILAETQYSRLGQEIVKLLEANRMKFKVELAGKSLPYLTHMDKGKFGVIVFENLESYLNMDTWNRQLLDKYCKEYNVGIIAFTRATESSLINAQVKDFPLYVHTNLAMKDYELNPGSKILRVTRAGEMVHGYLPGDDWTVFVPNNDTYMPLSYARTQTAEVVSMSNSIEEARYITAIQDLGALDGIQRVFFGNGFKLWLHRLLFLDALSYLSHGKFSIPLKRYVLIDVDDIFVGRKGIRLKPRDVKAMLAAQENIRKHHIHGFRFNLGYSGKYYHRGNEEENLGDDMILALKDHFWWFPHMWRHLQPHRFTNTTSLEMEMWHNYEFAKKHAIPVNYSYAVAPHHSGVYPVHEPLYEAWKRVWNTRVTSTEEYPHLYPPRYRKGFIHRGIKVLPRQTCGLYTHTVILENYPRGPHRLEQSIRGGDLFQSFVYNPVNIFMTHMSNYGNDRLALYTFESVLKFVQCWTNLRLESVPPVQLANIYFNMYPEERDPIWTNPCDDKRHLAIWMANKTCDNLPRFLVIGPQKTGTTALYTFLAMHPAITSNFKSPVTFEEVQFFSGRNYFRGLNWYQSFFPRGNYSYLFEKSATYFDSEVAPHRAYALLPRARLITIITNPAKRAYSWYQHMRAHSDRIAISYSFYNVVTADENSPRSLRDLRNRCLNPGLYAQHLQRWLEYYPANQLHIIDGEQLKLNPITIMEKVQKFLNIEPFFDYSKRLKYNPKKGFYCQITTGDHTKCLGRNKGRYYPPMELKAEKFLQSYYRRHNVALSKLLTRIGVSVPDWLEEELRDLQ